MTQKKIKKNGKCKVFIVEDNLVYQQLLAKQFDALTYDVKCFSKGEACVEQVKYVRPDILVLDYYLEGSLNGLETLKEVLVYHPYAFAVVISSEKGLNTEQNYSSYGRFTYIEKTETSVAGFRNAL